jgi:spore germination protein YaaH
VKTKGLTVGVLVAALVAAAPAAGARHAKRRCAGRAPTLLSFAPTGGTSGVLSWKRPRRPRGTHLRYRAWRDRDVVGQTPRLRMTVRVQPGRTYRFSVRAVSARGRVSPCAARIVRNLRHRAPSPPEHLAAADVGETGATLSWTAGRASASRIAGYRVYRDGVPLRQVATLQTHVSLSARRSYVFTVSAVDAQGYTSRPSEPVTIQTDHVAPSAPAGLAAGAVTDSSVDLSWSPSSAASGRIVGYRVYRDGVLLRQVDDTATTVTGLAGAQSYRFTVAAVDTLGYLSDPSAPLAVTTAQPPQTQGDAHVFLLASTGQSFSDLRAHYQQIGTVYPTYFECAADGTVSGEDDPLVTRWAHVRGIAVMPRLDCQSQTRLHLILTDPGVRGAVLGRLSELAQTQGYDGVNIDFEGGAATDRAALTAFAGDLANLLHGQGKRLSVDVSAKTSDATTGRSAFYDYAALAAVADTVFVMDWGKHWSTSAPGAIADLPWARSVADYVASMPNKRRFVLGFGLYGMDWPAGGGTAHPATPLEFDDVMNLADAVGATAVIDPVAAAPHFSYTDAQGVGHDVWYTDAPTVAAQIRLARDRGLGIGFWRLGREDQRIWDDSLLAPGVRWPAP